LIVNLAALANAAGIAQAGNLNVLGVFDSIMAPQYAVRHPSMVLAFRLRFEYEARALKIARLDADHRFFLHTAAEAKGVPSSRTAARTPCTSSHPG
jgi:hypothetical protein